jgi:Animal haem peroxidase
MTTYRKGGQCAWERRRHFLQQFGALTAAVSTGAWADPPERDRRSVPNSFTRMFPQLPPFADARPQVIAALTDMGKPEGIMDANDPLASGPKLLITDLSLSANNPNAAMPNGAAGTTFLGQFVDHDMTFDASSPLGVPTPPRQIRNVRLPALDLDSVYGGGPGSDPRLYDRSDRAKLKVESGGAFEDLPRLPDGTALIADPRNDEHIILAGLHAAFLLFHNRMVDRVRASRESDAADVGSAFQRARQLTTWHYQWIVLNEMLPSFIGRPMVDDILRRGRRFYRPGDENAAAMPVEFQGAAYRFGHSMVRPSYRANLFGDRGGPFFGFIFDPRGEGQADPEDLRGGSRSARRFIGWQTFFDFGDGEVKPRKLIDTRLSTPLFRLPLAAIASGTPPISLPQRNLLRQLTWEMPSGQRIAQAMGVQALRAGDFSELAGYGVGLENSTPLNYYVMKEAFLATGGQTLGPVGGRIVGEVIIGLMQTDRDSWMNAQPNWRPTLPSRFGAGEFRMVDFLTLAGVDPASRGQ